MKIKFLPFQPHCFAYGGFEIQIANNLKAIRSLGIDATQLDYWSKDNDFDILHCWGMGFPHYESIKWGKSTGKKVVASVLLYDYDTLYSKIKFKISSKIAVQRYLLEMFSKLDAVSVVNQKQAETCHSLYKVPEKKIFVIPNVVDKVYFDSNTSHDQTGSNKYILVVGNICARKNQINLAKACIQSNSKLVIIGRVMDGEADYGNKLQSIVDASTNITWIKGLTENTSQLLDYYKNAHVVALPSYIEQQPLSLLEGSICGKPLLIGNGAYSQQELYSHSRKVDPGKISSIIEGIGDVYENYEKYIQPFSTLTQCKAESVAIKYNNLYNSL